MHTLSSLHDCDAAQATTALGQATSALAAAQPAGAVGPPGKVRERLPQQTQQRPLYGTMPAHALTQGPPRGARGAARPAPATTAPAAPPPQARPGPRRHCPRHRTRPGCRSPRTHLACWRLALATLVPLLSPQSSSRRDRRRAPPARPSARRPGCSVAGRRCVEQTRRWRPAGTRQRNDVSAGRGTVRMRLLSQQAAPDTAAGG